MPRRLLSTLVVAAVVLVGCGAPQLETGDLELSRSTLGLPLDRAFDGGLRASAVMSLSLVNQTQRMIEIVTIEPVADEGLEVEYIGYSSCRRGCAGTQHWTPDTQKRVERGLDGTFPVPVRSDRDEIEDRPPPAELTFVMSVPTVSGADALERGCLRLLGINAEFSDGSSAFIASSYGPFVAALRAEDEPDDYARCDMDS
ncbi:MAG: hypothetical protein ACRDG7_06720 [Candidatus Limnocylindria bacterium]